MLPVRLADRQILTRHRNRRVRLDARQLPREFHLLAIFHQGRPLGLAGNLLEVIVEPLQRAELLQQHRGGFRPDAGHAGNVVNLIPHQRHEVDHPVRRHAVALLHGLLIHDEPVVVVWVVDFHPRPHQLQHILVARHQKHLHLGAGNPAPNGRQEILRLIALPLEDRDAQRPQQLLDDGQLRDERVRHGFALDLVALEPLVAERGLPRIEGDRQRVGLLGLAQGVQHHRKAVDRVGRAPIGRRQRADGVEGPVSEGGSVNEEGPVRCHLGTSGGRDRCVATVWTLGDYGQRLFCSVTVWNSSRDCSCASNSCSMTWRRV